jgi:hypothetical protein
MRRIILKMKGAKGEIELFVLPTDNSYKITELIEFYGLSDYKLLDWKIETITILK